MRIGVFVTASLLPVCLMAADTGYAAETRGAIGSVAEISVGDGLTFVRSNKPYPDFAIYEVRDATRVLLGIYIGNAPSARVSALQERTDIGSCKAVPSSVTNTPNYNFDAVIKLGGLQASPTFMHFYARNLIPEDLDRVRRILDSFTIRDGYTC